MGDESEVIADDGAGERRASREFMGLLAEHVPLALLADLAAPSAPASAEILRSEGLPDDAWWEQADGAGTPPDGSEPLTA